LKAAERGYVDDIIMPEQTRAIIADNLRVLETKNRVKPSKKHNTMPL
jgi:acetyl-CoA carboxylase carboxyltransferase component